MKKSALSLVGLTLFLSLAACATSKKSESVSLTNKAKAVALLRSMGTADSKPLSYVDRNKYTQRIPAGGADERRLLEAMKDAPPGSLKADVIRAFQDGDYVFTHTRYDFFGPKAGFDIFRFEDGLIVEQWSNLAPIARKPNSSGRSQFDGPTQARDHAKTRANKELISNFVDRILARGQTYDLGRYFLGYRYIQHNPKIGDGTLRLIRANRMMAARGMPMRYTKNRMILGEGDFVLSVSEGRFGDENVAFYDLFRVKDGRIAEHWDVIQAIPANFR